MNSADRRNWKLAVVRALSADGIHLATVRRTIGAKALNEIIDDAFRTAPDPARGAAIVIAQLKAKYGRELDLPIPPYSRD